MIVGHTEKVGSFSQHEAAANFERLEWGPASTGMHDRGTDYIAQVRDASGRDLGLLVGFQVKGGTDPFGSPMYDDDGGLMGWWFVDDDRVHIDRWLAHSVPHLVVLHDATSKDSYWAHVTEEAVVSTGIGAKIFVPAAQKVDKESQAALLEIAGANRPGVAWEGSVWMAGADIVLPARLRHALIVPRLIAPHPNADIDAPPSAEQIIAMLMQARLFELDRLSERFESIPKLKDALDHRDWTWRFASALYRRALDSDVEPLLRVAREARAPYARAAATVAAASALTEETRLHQALDLLDPAIARNDIGAVDHEWLLVQRARALAELGRLGEAREDALMAQGVRLSAPGDATVTALAASAAILLFNTASWGSKDIKDVITNSDTAASWWRAQVTVRGLWAITDEIFKEWAQSTSTTFGGEHDAHNNLASTILMASHVGDQAGWRSLSALSAKATLMQLGRRDDPGDVTTAITKLRRSGDEKAMDLAVRHLLRDGPASAIADAATEIDLEALTRTDARATLKLLERGGDVLDIETATRAAKTLRDAHDDPATFFPPLASAFLQDARLAEVLAAVLPAADPDEQRAAAEWLSMLAPVREQLPAAVLARVVEALPEDAWSDDGMRRAIDAADQHDAPLRFALLTTGVRRGDEHACSAMTAEALDGSPDALAALGAVGDLPEDIAAKHTSAFADEVVGVIADAENGRFGLGMDVVGNLVQLNLWHPQHARWDPVVDVLGHAGVMATAKRRALRLVADHTEQVPADVRTTLGSIARRIADGEDDPVLGPFDSRDAAAEAALAAICLGASDDEGAARQLVALLDGTTADRIFAAATAARSATDEALGILVGLGGDPSPDVRATVAAGLARRAASGEHGPSIAAALDRVIDDPGVRVPLAIADALRDRDGEIADGLRMRLHDHRSAAVRRAARRTPTM